MKKHLLCLVSSILFLASCKKESDSGLMPSDLSDEVQMIAERRCASHEVLQAQLKADPQLQKRLDDIEMHTKKIQDHPLLGRLVNGVIEIPVVVNVLYRTAAQNISQAQIQSQIDVLNEDFNNTNADRTKVPSYFTDEQTSIGIRFVLENVVRKSTTKRSWGTNDAMKKSSNGGINPTSPTTTLNMWACNLGQGLLGYAQFPGGNPATDGIVILYSAFGSRAKAPSGTYVNSYDLGRTATHEVGHWVNLRHIWGDANCGSDLVNDTPLHNTANYGCPATGHLSTCTGKPIEMTMNYMDYSNDVCMYMFSNGQKSRVDAVFASGGPRSTFR